MYDLLPPVRLIEAAAFVAAPLAGMTLAQLGWDVIRIDPPGGGPDARRWPLDAKENSLYWAGLNKGKRSVLLDTHRPEGAELAHALATAQDDGGGLLLTNQPLRGWMDRQALFERRPDMIVTQVRGNPDGSNAVDYTVNCAVGFPAITGPEGWGGPVNHVLPAWDAITGMHAALALVSAERARACTGSGRIISVALSDVAIAMAGHLGHLAEVELSGRDRPRYGNALYGGFGRDFAGRDGRRVMIVALTLRQWRALGDATGLRAPFAALGQALGRDLDQEGERFAAREAIALLLEPWCAARSVAEIGAIFDQAQVCWGPYQSFAELLRDDPRCSTGNPMLARVHHPQIGACLIPGSPLAIEDLQRHPPARAPRLGEHTEQVLAEVLALPAHEIARLHDDRVVAGMRYADD